MKYPPELLQILGSLGEDRAQRITAYLTANPSVAAQFREEHDRDIERAVDLFTDLVLETGDTYRAVRLLTLAFAYAAAGIEGLPTVGEQLGELQTVETRLEVFVESVHRYYPVFTKMLAGRKQ